MAKLNGHTPSGDLPSTRGTFLAWMEVREVRCFGVQQRLSLLNGDGSPSRWTVILGENGVGKTTLLQLLAIASGGSRFDPYLFEWPDYEDGPRSVPEFTRGKDSKGFVHAELRTAGHAKSVEFTIGVEGPTGPGSDRDVKSVVCGYGAGRRLSLGRYSRRHRSWRMRQASLFVDAPLRNAEEWLLGEDYAAAKEGNTGPASRRLERLKELLTRLLPEVSDVRVGEHRRWGPSVEFKTPYGWVPLDGLSLGYQSLVAWMVDFASAMFERYERHTNPLAEPAIVLVDEIDLHLHPKWQRDLMRFLSERFPNTQFIVTAHSPLVVQSATDANVILLKREEDHTVIENNPTNVRNWRIDQILTSDLYGLPTARPPQLDESIRKRREILTKSKLTAADRKRLRTLEQQIGDLPGGETPEEQRAMALILRASKDIKSERPRKKR